MLKRFALDNGNVNVTSFTTDKGAEEIYLAITADKEDNFIDAVSQVYDSYLTVTKELGLTRENLVFGRVSMENQERVGQFHQSPLFQELQDCSLSLIVQPPLNSDRVNLLLYFIIGDTIAKTRGKENAEGRKGSVLVTGASYSQLWLSNITGDVQTNIENQTKEAFTSCKASLQENNMTLLPNGIRTWVYVDDIDNNYSLMTEARKEWFATEGLTDATRYLASTGVEGVGMEKGIGVTMDFMGIAGLADEQIVKMEVLDNMPPTISYAVTFERGLKVLFGDRAHYHVSGTASIDKSGKVIHVGDVEKQSERMIENVKALLHESGTAIEEMAYCIAYLRNPEDYHIINKILQNHLPVDIPLIVVHGAICRPEWLVEIEGVVVKEESHPYPDFL